MTVTDLVTEVFGVVVVAVFVFNLYHLQDLASGVCVCVCVCERE